MKARAGSVEYPTPRHEICLKMHGFPIGLYVTNAAGTHVGRKMSDVRYDDCLKVERVTV